MIKRGLSALGVLLIVVGHHAACFADMPDTIRVLVLKDSKEIHVTIKKGYKIIDARTALIVKQGKNLYDAVITLNGLGLSINEEAVTANRLKIIAEDESSIHVNKRSLRGEVDIIRDRSGKLSVINNIDLEYYIKGVLYHEVSHLWPLNVLMVQAICARSYAIYQIQNSLGKDYDVTSDIYSQVYGGRHSERYRTNLAVDKSKGIILTYQGKVFPAYYYATCGGMTEAVSELWNQDLAPLRGVKCQYCRSSPHYFWKKNFRLKDIQNKLNEKGYQLGLIKDISVRERNKSGRIKLLTITSRNGKSLSISGKDFREIIGPNVIKSNNYTIEMQGYFMDLLGKGWGHGVGMCQWGAKQMASEGFKYDEILKFYYPGVTISNIHSAP